MIIGYERGYYPEKRCIVDKVDAATYADITYYNPRMVLKRIQKRIGFAPFTIDEFKHSNPIPPKVDLIHFFNSVSYSSIPWVSTFESFLPRFPELYSYHHGHEREIVNPKKVQLALDQIASESCRKILAISECAKRIQLDFLRNFSGYEDVIANKLEVLHPPQETLIGDVEADKDTDPERITFVFLGASFHRKGGAEILRVFSRLRKEYNFNLIIISRLLKDNYATKETDSDVEAIRKQIIGSDWIEYHHYLPNHKAMEVLKSSDVALLPTWADSYGYSLLEYQAAGCPVISTNVRAMPEINNNEVGWIIEIPKNDLGEALYLTREQRETLRHTIEERLEVIVQDILNNPHQIQEKAKKSLERIRKQHAPQDYGRKLADVYDHAAYRK